jgi:hypothetical protein
VKHVRRRVDHSQRAVDVERVDVAARDVEALGQHDLEGIAGGDVVLDPPDRVLEAGLAEGRARRRQRRIGRQRRHRLHRRARAAQGPDDRVDPRARPGVGGLGALGSRHVGRRDDLHRLPQVVEDHDGVGDRHAQGRHVDPGLGAGRQLLEGAHAVVGDPADRAAPEPRQAGRRRRPQLAHDLGQRGGRIRGRPGRGPRRATAVDVEPGDPGLAALAHQDRPRRDTDEGVGRPGRAADHRLEEEAVVAGAQGGVGRHRGVAVGAQLAVDRDQVGGLGRLHEAVPVRIVHAPCVYTAGRRPSPAGRPRLPSAHGRPRDPPLPPGRRPPRSPT